MEEINEGETFEIDEPRFECSVCENTIEFKFEPEAAGPEEVPGEVPEEFEEELKSDISTPENFADEVEGEFEEGQEEESMKIDCECGAEYIITKVPGVPGFKVTHLKESGSELVEKEFEETL